MLKKGAMDLDSILPQLSTKIKAKKVKKYQTLNTNNQLL